MRIHKDRMDSRGAPNREIREPSTDRHPHRFSLPREPCVGYGERRVARFRPIAGRVLDLAFDPSKGRVCGKLYGESIKEDAARVNQERARRPSGKIAGSPDCMRDWCVLGRWDTLLYSSVGCGRFNRSPIGNVHVSNVKDERSRGPSVEKVEGTRTTFFAGGFLVCTLAQHT